MQDPLGRGIVVRKGAQGLPLADRVTVDGSSDALEVLGPAWRERKPITVELTIDPKALKEPERWQGDVYSLTPAFDFPRERLHFLVWANNYDHTRDGEPIWWHGRLAQRLGRLPEGIETDGGPRGSLPFPVIHRESIQDGHLHLTQPAIPKTLELAPDQRQAVLHPAGAARILAPAGSGKTRVLTERLRHLLTERGYERDRVTAVAYNRRAAAEMASRTQDFKPVIQTLHALGYSLLGRPRLLEERQVRGILSSLLTLPKVLGQDPLAPYIEALAEVRLALRDPEKVEARRGDVEGFARLFPRYRDRLRREGAIDYDEQIYAALELLLKDPEARKAAQRRCTHLLVDEFQDLTPAYLLLVRLLAGPAGQVYGVGDDDQVIYGYAGADPGFLVDYDQYFPGATNYALEVNYRCPIGVVDAAARLLTRNKRRVPKTIRAGSSTAGLPEVLKTPAEDMAAAATRVVQRWEDHRNTAVLARTQACLLPIQVYLKEAGIPYHSLVDPTLLQRTGMRAALAWLRLAQGALSPPDLLEALRRPSRRLKRELVENASRCRTLGNLATFAAQQEPWIAGQLEEFERDLRLVGRARDVPQALKILREHVGLGLALEELDHDAAASHLDDLVALEQTARLHPDWATFEGWLHDALEQKGKSGVRLSTVHRVKGMEWDHVIVYGAQKGLWPHRLADDVEEERRVFHVAITRARKDVVIIADTDHPSKFVKELKVSKKVTWGPEALAAAQQLREPERGVFLARHKEGLDIPVIAQRMGKSESAVRTWLQLAERDLRQRLD